MPAHDADPEEVVIEEAATRPPMMPVVRLPLTLGAALLAAGAILFVLISSTKGEIIVVAVDAMICFSIRPLVAVDYHGFDIFIVWLRLDFCCFDTRVWGGTRVAPFPLRVAGFRGMSDV